MLNCDIELVETDTERLHKVFVGGHGRLKGVLDVVTVPFGAACPALGTCFSDASHIRTEHTGDIPP